MMDRRTLLQGMGSASVAGLAHAPCCWAAERFYGCCIPNNQSASFLSRSVGQVALLSGQEPPVPSSGDHNFDVALAHALLRLALDFDVLPGFAYFKDGAHANAYATSADQLGRSDGTVLFGLNMLKQLRSMPEHPEIAVVAVCAHEFGHILQYKRKLMPTLLTGQPTVKRVELQADFFTGYFVGMQRRRNPAFPAAVAALTQYNFGDTHFDDEDHHGTHAERGAAVVKGYQSGFEKRHNLEEAVKASMSYALTL